MSLSQLVNPGRVQQSERRNEHPPTHPLLQETLPEDGLAEEDDMQGISIERAVQQYAFLGPG
jgi:hypothetical protein